MPVIELAIVILLGVLAAVLLHSKAQQRQQILQMENAFYKLLEDQDSCVSLIQLAAVARADAQLAKRYLDRQIKLFDGVIEVDADGDTFYRFPKLHLQLSADKEFAEK